MDDKDNTNTTDVLDNVDKRFKDKVVEKEPTTAVRVPSSLVYDIKRYVAYYRSITKLERGVGAALAAFRKKNDVLNVKSKLTLTITSK